MARMPIAGRGSALIRENSPRLASTAPNVRMPRGSKAIASNGACIMDGGALSAPVRPPTNSPAATTPVNTKVPTRKISQSLVLDLVSRRRAKPRIAKAAMRAARLCAVASVARVPTDKPQARPAMAYPAATAITPRQRSTTAAPRARPEAGVAPSKTPSPNPKARQANSNPATPRQTTNSGHGPLALRIPVGISRPTIARRVAVTKVVKPVSSILNLESCVTSWPVPRRYAKRGERLLLLALPRSVDALLADQARSPGTTA